MSTRRPMAEAARPQMEPQDPEAESDLADLAARLGAGEDFLARLERAVDARHPLELLRLASSILSALDPRTGSGAEGEEVSVSVFADALLAVGRRQTDALASVIGAMSPEEEIRERTRREVVSRRLPVPGWVKRIDQTEPVRASAMTHVFADGEDVAVEVRLPDDRLFLVMAYVDHNLGTVLADAFVVDDNLAHVLRHWHEADRSGASEDQDLPLSQARARLAEAIETGARTTPPLTTETWPQCRPLVEWILRAMPPGGAGYERPQWSKEDLADLTDRFARSPQAADLSEDEVGLADLFIDFATSHGSGDPLRWSPTSVELLLEWLPAAHAPPAHVEAVPRVLRAFVSFSHAERGLARDLTAQTLGSIDEHAGSHEIPDGGQSDQSDAERTRRKREIALRRRDPRRGFPHADPRRAR